MILIIGLIGLYLAAGLSASRIYWQGRTKARKTDDGEEVLASFMVPFWPLILLGMGMHWIVTHEAGK